MRFVIDVCPELANQMRITQHYSVIMPEDYVTKIETYRSTSELHVKVYILILVRLLVLTFIFKCVSLNFPTPALFSSV